MKTIRVLNCGCCSRTLKLVSNWARARGGDLQVEGITDMDKIYSYGVMDLPAVMVDDTILPVSRLSDQDLLKRLDRLVAPPSAG